jgi:PAS domain S-box-containing protein
MGSMKMTPAVIVSEKNNLAIIFVTVVFTMALTIGVILFWEKILLKPFYEWVDARYPGVENTEKRRLTQQRTEHFFISVTVDGIVVTVLLFVLRKQQRRMSESERQHEAERTEDLRRSELRYRSLFENNPQPMWVFDEETLAFLAVNDSAIRHYGYTRDEFLRMTLRDLRLPEDVPALLETLANDGGLTEKSGPWKHKRKDSSLIDVEVATHPLDFDGRKAALVSVTDVTERMTSAAELRRMQDRLRHNEKIAALGRVAAQVAHEVKNPLAGLRLYSLHLKSKVAGKLSEAEIDIVNKIADGIGRLTETTEQILSFARPINMNLTGADLNRIVADASQLLEPQSSANQIKVELRLAESLPSVMLDEASIHAALMNLMLNAIQAMPAGGLLEVQTETRDQHVLVTIRDTGKGMSDEQIRNVFEPFYTTRAQGLGLGMPYAKKIIEQHRGTISVESREGEGTTIEIELPLSE